MKHKVKVTVLDKKLYPELQQEYCTEPNSGTCPCYNVGDEFIFYRDEVRDDFWRVGLNTLVKTNADPDTVAGGPKMPFCSEAWDAPLHLYRITGRFHHEGLDESGKCDDNMLLGRNKTGYL